LRPWGKWARLNSASGLALALVFSGIAIAPRKATAQEVAAEVTKRKVKTRVSPEYSALARQMKATGKVKIEVTISPDGRVTSTRTVGGSPVLVSASLEALKKWRFETGPKETMEIIEFDFSTHE
jgi:TonB family protein